MTCRLPAHPLLQLAPPAVQRTDARWYCDISPGRLYHREDGRVSTLAEAVGVTPRTVHRWLAKGMTEEAADRAAVRLGRHPVEVWPDWYEVTADPATLAFMRARAGLASCHHPDPVKAAFSLLRGALEVA